MLATLTAALLSSALVAAPGPLAPYGDPRVAFTFGDPRISESSGLVASSRTPGVVFTHNDSGDDARFFAVGPDGRTLATYTLPGVQARDWEDIARGPDEQGRSSLWLGDIGDNSAVRDTGVLVHRVREPVPGRDARVTTERPTSFRLRYPDGPGDAETLLVHPVTGRLYVVSKPLAGASKVYAAPARLDPDGPNALELVARVDLDATGTPGGPGIGGLAQLLVTAGDVSPDGTRVALRSYTDVYEWPVEGADLAAAFAGEPTVTPLPSTRQGEGLAYSADGSSLLTSTEGEGSPVHRLTARPRVAPPPAPAPDVAGGEPSSDPAGPVGAEAVQGRSVRLPGWAVVAVAAAGALGVALVVGRRGRRHR